MAKQLNMTSGHPGKLLLRFALPLMLGNIFQQLYTVVDTAIVGKGVGMNALAALGTVDWLNWMYLGIAQGLTQGFGIRMAQKFGQGDREGLKRSVGLSVVLTLWISVLMALLAQLSLPAFMQLLHVPEELQSDAALYSRIVMAGIPALLFYNLTSSVLRSVGDSKTPLIAMAIAALTNIGLDCLAVFVLRWGIAGAAAATVAAQCLSGLVCAIRIRRAAELRIDRTHLAWDWALAKKLMYLGLPVAAQNIVICIGGMILQSVVNGFETSFIAGFTASNKLYGVLEIAAISYGYAVTTYAGQNFGAGNWERIRKGTRWAVVISLMTSVVIGTIMILLGRPITMLFISGEKPELAAAAGETAYRYLCLMSLALPVLYLLYVYRSALQGMGNTRVPLLSGVLEFVTRVGGALIIAWWGYQNGILCIGPMAWLTAAILLCVAYYITEAKLEKR